MGYRQRSPPATHANVAHYDDTDWSAILRLYDDLRLIDGGPIINLNQPAAILSGCDASGARSGLNNLAAELENIQYYHTTVAEVYLALGDCTRP